MPGFSLQPVSLDVTSLRDGLADAHAGAYASFEGWVRDHNDGRRVTGLHYEAYTTLAQMEGARVLGEAMSKFQINDVRCVHRVGDLVVGELAVWVGVTAAHRAPAFDACQFVIDAIKARVPIWKQERYAEGDKGWLHPLQPPVPANGGAKNPAG